MQQQLKLAIGCDLAGYDLKCEVMNVMQNNGYSFDDVGCHSSKEGMYAFAAKDVADKVARGDADYGILICGTGQGMAIAANKVKGIRAALVFDVFPAVLSKEHNNTNVLCTGAWMMDCKKAVEVIEAWLFAQYTGLYDEGMKLLEQYESER